MDKYKFFVFIHNLPIILLNNSKLFKQEYLLDFFLKIDTISIVVNITIFNFIILNNGKEKNDTFIRKFYC